MLRSRTGGDCDEDGSSRHNANSTQFDVSTPLGRSVHYGDEPLRLPPSLNRHTRIEPKPKAFDVILRDLAASLEQARAKLQELAKAASQDGIRCSFPKTDTFNTTPKYQTLSDEDGSQAATSITPASADDGVPAGKGLECTVASEVPNEHMVVEDDVDCMDKVPQERHEEDAEIAAGRALSQHSVARSLPMGDIAGSPGFESIDKSLLCKMPSKETDNGEQASRDSEGDKAHQTGSRDWSLTPQFNVNDDWLPRGSSDEYDEMEDEFGLEQPLPALREQWLRVAGADLYRHNKMILFRDAHNLSSKLVVRGSLSKRNRQHGLARIRDIATDRSGKWWVCSPDSRQRILWDIMSILFIAADLLRLPSYVFSIEAKTRMDVMEWCCNIFWALDIVMSFRTGFFMGHVIEMDRHAIAWHYMRTWLLFDVCLVLPEWIARVLDGPDTGISLGKNGRVARYTRMVRIFKFRHLTRRVDTLLVNHAKLTEMHSFIRGGALLCIGVHFIACLWFGIGSSSEGRWVDDEDLGAESAMVQYLQSVRWTLAQLNGETDQQPGRTRLEQVFIIICALLALLFMSMLVSTLTAQIMQIQRLMDEDSRSTENLASYLARKKVSYSVAYLTRIYLKSQKRMQSDKDVEARLFKSLPRTLMADLLYEVRAPTMCFHSFFVDLNTYHLKIIRCLCCEAVGVAQVQTAQVVFEREEEAQCTFIMESGDLQYADHCVDLAYIAKLKVREENMLSMMTQVVGGISHNFAPFASVVTSASTPDLSSVTLGRRVSKSGVVLAEGALWMEWQTRGELIAVTTSMLFVIYIAPFLSILAGCKEALCHGARYAHMFQWYVRQMSPDEVSDLTHLEPSQFPDAEQRDYLFSSLANDKSLV